MNDECTCKPCTTEFPPIQAITDAPPIVPVDYAGKCKRRRIVGPTPCLCCPGECVGENGCTMKRCNDCPLNQPQRQRVLDTDSAARKQYPMVTGLLDYFPDALAEVAKLSYLGNQKHNPGEPMHHARGKSMDHADCIARHLVGRGGFDGDTRESAALAWRALANLQEEMERELGLPLPRGARAG